jgi:hypothetical protein
VMLAARARPRGCRLGARQRRYGSGGQHQRNEAASDKTTRIE